MPPTARKPVAPGTRRVRLALPPCGDEPGVLEIHAGEKVQEYLLFAGPRRQDGRGFRLKQFGGPRKGEEYHVFIAHDPAGDLCDCPDHQYRGGKCKHLLAIAALLSRDLLP